MQFGGTVPSNSVLFGGTIPPNSVLFGGSVPPNSASFFIDIKKLKTPKIVKKKL